MIRKLPFIFPTISNQSTSIMSDSFKEIPLHLFQFNITIYQHCHQVGYMKNQCFDLHHSHKCQKEKKAKMKNNSLQLEKFLAMELTSQFIAYVLLSSLNTSKHIFLYRNYKCRWNSTKIKHVIDSKWYSLTAS